MSSLVSRICNRMSNPVLNENFYKAVSNQNNMEGKWTFCNVNDQSWENELFDTEDEVIEAAVVRFDYGFIIGRLELKEDGNYTVNHMYTVF